MNRDFADAMTEVLRYRLGDDAFTEAVFHLQQGAAEGGDAHKAAVQKFGETLKAANDPRHHVVLSPDQLPPDAGGPHEYRGTVQHVLPTGDIHQSSYRLRYHPPTGKFEAAYAFVDGDDKWHRFKTLLDPDRAKEFAAFPETQKTVWHRGKQRTEGDTAADAARFVDEAPGQYPPPPPPKSRWERTPPPVTDRPLTNDELRRDFMEGMLKALTRKEGGGVS